MLRYPYFTFRNVYVSAMGTLPADESNRTDCVEVIGKSAEAIASINRILAIELDFVLT
jgi:hypothetical protein